MSKSLKVINISDSGTDSITFDSSKFEIENFGSVAQVLNWQLARRRSGTASVKDMHEISGSTAKPFKQKGTGNARQGSKRAVQMRGGRTCFGPQVRSFDFAIPKKVVKKGLSDVLKAKLKSGQVTLFKDGYKKDLKTSKISKLLQDNKIEKVLFLYDGADKESVNLVRSVRNIKNAKALDIKAVNAYDIVKFDSLLIDEKLFQDIKKVIS